MVSLMDCIDEQTTPVLMDISNVHARAAIQKNTRLPLLKLKIVGGPGYGRFFVRNPLDNSK